MDGPGNDRDLGWEDVGSKMEGGAQGGSHGSGFTSGPMGSMGQMGGEVMGNAVTDAMINHFTREFSAGTLSLWPQVAASARKYFNVHHGYVLRKAAWQLVPMNSMKKKSQDGELGGEKEWTARLAEGVEVEIEEPDLYLPCMAFVSYVLLCGILRGLQEQFHPEVLSATITFALVVLTLETTLVKAALFMAGAVNAPILDLAALLGYKFFYLSLTLLLGLLLGRGGAPGGRAGFIFHLLELGLMVACGGALWQALRRLARMQPALGQECVTDVHKAFIKGLPVLQAFFCWCLMPSWPEPRRAAVEAAVAEAVTAAVTVITTTIAAAVTEVPLAAEGSA